VTHDKKHLDLAKHYLDIRGRQDSVNRSRHNQSYRPVLEQREAVGHAVNCATLMVSLADVGVLTGLNEYFVAAERMWTDAVERKMYITGGVGTTGNEGFGEPYVLPNISAYSETCAVLMFMSISHRLFLATGDSKYIDVMERGMLQQRAVGRVDGRRSILLRQPARERGRRTRPSLAAGVARVLPAESRAIPRVDAGVCLRAGTGGIDLRQSLRLERSAVHRGRSAAHACRRQRNAVGRRLEDFRARGDGVRSAIKLRIPGWARNVARAGRSLFVRRQTCGTGGDCREREGHPGHA
jgi:hypothetical protein